MDKDYFNSLKNSVQDSERPTSNSSNTLGKAFLTVKIDVDCKLYCDGDFLDLFEANKVKKIPIETGQHLITIESEHCDGVSEDHVIDAAEAGKNYLLLVNDLKQKEKERIILEQQNEAYFVLSNNNKTLTFYYDNNKESREGIDFNKIAYDGNGIRDLSIRHAIKTIIFDDSFSNFHSIYSTAYWFMNMDEMTSIKGLHNLNTENVMDMSAMFCCCCSLQELDLSNFDTRNVTDMYMMFEQCKSLLKLDLSSFDTSNVTDMSMMFEGCSYLKVLDIRGFNMDKVEYEDDMFEGVNESIIRK